MTDELDRLVEAQASRPALPDAACAGLPLDLFFGHQDASTLTAARAVCAGCRHLEACREWALGEPMLVGLWGGLTEKERRQLRRRAAGGRRATRVAPLAAVGARREPPVGTWPGGVSGPNTARRTGSAGPASYPLCALGGGDLTL